MSRPECPGYKRHRFTVCGRMRSECVRCGVSRPPAPGGNWTPMIAAPTFTREEVSAIYKSVSAYPDAVLVASVKKKIRAWVDRYVAAESREASDRD